MNLPAPYAIQKGSINRPLQSVGIKERLSICMIVKDEEARIAEAIQHILPLADEIVIVDTGSKDQTVNILRKFPVKIIEADWQQDFSLARNLSLKHAASAWILWLDADDRLSPDQFPLIQQMKKEPLDRAFSFQLLSSRSASSIGLRYPQIRLFPNHPSLRFSGRVHEKVTESIYHLGLHLVFTPITIQHLGYEDSGTKTAKARRNLAIMQLEKPYNHPGKVLEEGDAYCTLEEWEQALEIFLMGYGQLKERDSGELLQEFPYRIGNCYRMLKQNEKAEEWYLRGVELFPQHSETLYRLGELLFSRKEDTRARLCFSLVVGLFQYELSSQPSNEFYRMLAFDRLCEIAIRGGKWDSALRWATRFLQEFPELMEPRQYLLKIYGILGFDRLSMRMAAEIERLKTSKY